MFLETRDANNPAQFKCQFIFGCHELHIIVSWMQNCIFFMKIISLGRKTRQFSVNKDCH